MRRIAAVTLLLLSGCATVPPPAGETPVPAPVSSAPPATPVVPAEIVKPSPESVVSTASTPASPPRVPVAPQMQGLQEFADANDERLLQVYVGMSRAAVERLMDGRQSGSYLNPYKRQILPGANGKAYEVLFYVTRAPRAGRRISEAQLTPVILANERVTAIGRYPLKKLRRSVCQARGETSCP